MKVSNFLGAAKLLPSTFLRAVSLETARIVPSKKGVKRVFNLDLHISVIRDLTEGLKSSDIKITNWSISRHNHIFRSYFKGPDPVRFINARNWQKIDESSIAKFLKYYKRFLSQFDGFIVTHTPVFHQIFESLGKPILIINSTRYEAPFSNNPEEWEVLNRSLIQGVKSGQTQIYSNNDGDRKYLEYFTGLNTEVVPSVCDYTSATWNNAKGELIYLENRLPKQIRERLSRVKYWKPSSQVLGPHFEWSRMQEVGAIFLIPYNISTMQLFEFATAGIPVVVPNHRFLEELYWESLALQELSYFQTGRQQIQNLSLSNPNNIESLEFMDFWLSSADFYNSSLMPNVRTIDSFEELEEIDLPKYNQEYISNLNLRNGVYANSRAEMLSKFLEIL